MIMIIFVIYDGYDDNYYSNYYSDDDNNNQIITKSNIRIIYTTY